MIRLYNLDFCKLEIHRDHVIATMHEGIVVSVKNNSILIKIAEEHFKNAPFVYITHRIHSYSVDPIVYIKTAKIPNLVGFAVVSKDPIQKTLTKYEKTFFEKEFRRFDDMKSALIWKDEMVKKKSYKTTSLSYKYYSYLAILTALVSLITVIFT